MDKASSKIPTSCNLRSLVYSFNERCADACIFIFNVPAEPLRNANEEVICRFLCLLRKGTFIQLHEASA